MQGDFSQFFKKDQFNERELGEMEFVLNSPAYERTFKRYMLGILNTMNNMWKDRSQERKDQYPDEYLAGGAAFGEGLMQFFDRIIQETSMERVHRSMEGVSNDELYDLARARGEVRPVVGLDQSASPQEGLVDPDEF